jgi:hypothetical protein
MGPRVLLATTSESDRWIDKTRSAEEERVVGDGVIEERKTWRVVSGRGVAFICSK